MKTNKTSHYFLIGILFSIFTIILLYSKFTIFSFDSYKPRLNYWDLNNDINPLWNCFQTSGLELFSLDLDTFPSLETCRNFTYGYFSLASFGLFNSITTNATFWGILQILVLNLFVARSYFHKLEKSKLMFSLLALFSPGFFLLVASGNMDIQIAILLLLASFFLRSGSEKLALTLVCITALFKFYTSPILLLLYFLVKNKNAQKYGIVLILATAATILFQMIHTPIPPFPAGAQNKFGVSIFANYARKAGVEMSQSQGTVLGILLLFVTLAFIYLVFSRTKKGMLELDNIFFLKNEFLYWSFIIFAGTSFVCYISALNVDYRLTFFALAGIALIQIDQLRIKYLTSLFPYVWIVSLWFSFPSVYLSKYIGLDLQPIGDVAIVGTLSYFIFQSFFVFKLLRRNMERQD